MSRRVLGVAITVLLALTVYLLDRFSRRQWRAQETQTRTETAGKG